MSGRIEVLVKLKWLLAALGYHRELMVSPMTVNEHRPSRDGRGRFSGSKRMAYPATFRYSKQHQWIDVKGDVGTIGLTDYAQSQLNEIVDVELPKPGAELEAGKPLGSVESVKAVSDIDAPVSGEVVEVNSAVRNAPEKINSDPHGLGWLVKVRLKDSAEADALMDAAAYEVYVAAAGTEAAH
jgi:glycine cleavage system H protein